MDTLKFKVDIIPEYFKRPPNLRISLNEKILFDGRVEEPLYFDKELEVEDESTYKLNFTLYGKSKYDTIIENEEIIKDTLIKIDRIELDDIDFTRSLSVETDKCYYIHDGSNEKHTFHDTMGVNGTSTVEFTTPFYVWLLETL